MTHPDVDAPGVIPSRADPTVWRAAHGLGGPWGRHAGVQSWWTPVRWILAMTVGVLLLGVGEKADCLQSGWTGFQPYTHVCESTVPDAWTLGDVGAGAVPYRDTNLPAPVVTGAVTYLAGAFSRGLHALDAAWHGLGLYAGVAALLLALCALLIAWATGLTAGRRPYDAAIFAVSPLLVFHAFSSWDLVGMACVSAALLAWARCRPILAGVLLGLGTAATLYPVLILVAIWILAIRTARRTEATWATGGAALAWLAVNGPVAVAWHGGWWHYYRASIDSETERTTLWAIVRTMVSGSVVGNDQVHWTPPGVAVALAVVVGLLGVAWLGLRAPTRPRLAQLALLCVLVYLLTTKHWSPWHSLWLLPLLALARPRWRLSLVWQFSEIGVWVMTMLVQLSLANDPNSPLYAAGARGFGVSYGWLVVAVLVRDVLLLVLGALVVQEMWHPELDVVRLDGTDDPGGGVFDGAPDYWAAEAASADLRYATSAP